MAGRFIAYLLIGSFLTFIHDIFNIGDGLMIIVYLFYWRGIVHALRFIRSEREHGR